MSKIIGAHLPFSELTRFLNWKKIGLNYAQICLTSPQTYNLPKKHGCLRDFYDTYKTPIIVHGPFLCTFLKDNMFGVKYYAEIINLADNYDIPIIYVTHVGKPGKDLLSESLKWFKKHIQILDTMQHKNVTLCLENDAGSKHGNSINTAEGLFALKTMGFFPTSIKFCFDTEHAYASGLPFRYWNSYTFMSHITHLNPIPKIVHFRSHLDRHGQHLLKDSRWLRLLKSVYKRSNIAILEKDPKLISEDLNILRTW